MLKKIIKKYNKYLPSTGFRLVVGGGMLVFLVVLAIFSLIKSEYSFTQKKEKGDLKNATVAEILQTDTDGDGVYDWEEALWGTDKNNKVTFGKPDKQYIDERRSTLQAEQKQTDQETTNTVTDQFAKQFFASYVALKDSGQDKDAINNLSYSLGEKIGDPELPNIYNENSVKVSDDDTDEAKKDYYSEMQKVFNMYKDKGLGDELDIVNTGLIDYTSGKTNTDYSNLANISQAYKDYAKAIMNIRVPTGYSTLHIAIANSAHNTGVGVAAMMKIITDPIIGLTGINQYDKYSKEFMEAVENLENKLSDELGS